MDWAALVFLAVMIEGIVTYGSTICPKGKCQWKMLFSMLLGIMVAINFKIDLFQMFGVESAVPLISKILTGIIISRGSNYVADLLKITQTVFNKS
ncbi:MAG: hypothetical protein M0R40_10525 [Firmicutes bacterium]|nr:hypothetical protein [Bacillota bacterium]